MNSNNCQKIVTITQISETCWFNALLMVIFYSDLMKKLVLTKKWIEENICKNVIQEL